MAKFDKVKVIAILTYLVILVTMVYGPIAAMLVEMFPTRIRYTSMSLPYHIGNGWFGGLLPTTAFAIVAQTGNMYNGLWYPIIASPRCMTFVIGMPVRQGNQGRGHLRQRLTTAGLGIVATDIDHLLALGFLAPAEGAAPAPTAPLAAQPPSASAVPSAAAATGAALPAANKSELFSQAWPVATRLTATLGLRGFRLNVAVERCMDYDELLALLPKITDALGPEKTRELREALRV
jgi:hypothetical protein